MSKDSVRKSFGPAGTPITFEKAEKILAEAGRISKSEEAELHQQVKARESDLDPRAVSLFQDVLEQLPELRQDTTLQNGRVEPEYKSLVAEAKARLVPGQATRSYGGNPVPETLKTFLAEQLAQGVIVYDVRQLDSDPFYNYNHDDLGPNGLQTTGVYSPYAQEQDAYGSLSFEHTELTPQKLEAERTTVQTYNVLDTTQGHNGFTEEGGKGRAILKQVTAVGSARIQNSYDNAYWPDEYGRTPGGQKWAGNFAILADGSVHAVPASRRSSGDQMILTTASLGRGKLELFNGHLFTDDTGTVTYVGKSGRLKDFKTVDAIELLKAAGFKVREGLTVTQE
ncbi:MAG: hypothetical protein IPJ65_41300 [Archangiaceae bacterium]|nr:hypothetical protein [Archangiaceae bacterium]